MEIALDGVYDGVELALRLDIDLSVLFQTEIHDLSLGLHTIADKLHPVFGLSTQVWFAQRPIKADSIEALNQPDTQGRRHEVLCLLHGLCQDVLPVDDLGDVVRNGGVRSDPILIHESNEVCFSEVVGRSCRSFLQVELVWHELLSFLKVWNRIAVPFVVGVDFKIVAGEDNDTAGMKVLPGDLDLDRRLLAFCVGRARGQKATSDKLVDSTFLSFQTLGTVRGMDWGMGLVVLATVTRRLEGSIEQPGNGQFIVLRMTHFFA